MAEATYQMMAMITNFGAWVKKMLECIVQKQWQVSSVGANELAGWNPSSIGDVLVFEELAARGVNLLEYILEEVVDQVVQSMVVTVERAPSDPRERAQIGHLYLLHALLFEELEIAALQAVARG